MYSKVNMRFLVQLFVLMSIGEKNWQDELQALEEEYWNRPEADDALVRFAKIAANKKEISFYDKFKKYQQAEKARMQEKLNRMDEVVRQYEQSRYSEQSEMGYE